MSKMGHNSSLNEFRVTFLTLPNMFNDKEHLWKVSQAEQTLAKVGSDKSQLISVTIYITDFANVGALNDVWSAWLPADSAPSRACLKVELANPAYLVEMAFVAAVAD